MRCLLPKAINHPEKLPVSPSVPPVPAHTLPSHTSHIACRHKHKCTCTAHAEMHTMPPPMHMPNMQAHTPSTQALDELTTTYTYHTHMIHTPHRFYIPHTIQHTTQTPYMCTYVHAHRNTDMQTQAHMPVHTAVSISHPDEETDRVSGAVLKYPKRLPHPASPAEGPSQAPAPVSLLGAPVLSTWCLPRAFRPLRGSG